jgi:anaerobic magnesium-protoporphyrin IX monomethyl ester cyclase
VFNLSRKNVLFIVHDGYQDFNHLPLGPAYLASMLEKNCFSSESYCMDVYHYTNEQLAEKLERSEYDIICLGYMAARFMETVVGLCEVINRHKKGAWFVLGGPGPSPIPRYSLLKTRADIVAIGEAEETMVELMRCRKTKERDLSGVKGIAYRIGDDVTVNPRRPPIANLDSIPFPAWHIFPMEKYIENFKAPGMEDSDRMLSIITSRGCVNRCTFCYRMEKGIRVRSLGNVIEEMKLAVGKYGINYFFIVDELFVVSEKRVLDFERMLKEENLDIKFTVDARVDIFNEKITRSLKNAGCAYVNIGFESGTQRILDEMGKNTTVEQNISAMETCKKIGLPAGLNFIWGFPGDDRETLFRSVELIKKYNQYHQLRTIRPVTSYPGTPLYYQAIEKGLLEGPEDFFRRFKNSDLITVNFTGFDDRQCYGWLLDANRELIYDHYMNTSDDMEAAGSLVKQFRDLYEGRTLKFRGARTYGKKAPGGQEGAAAGKACSHVNVLAVIPARGGSRRIPNKNIKDLHGKPLIAWAIQAVLGSRLVDRLVVSSDSEEIRKIAGSYGASVVERPAFLATDTSTSESAVLHALEEAEKEGFSPGIVVLVQATSPLLLPEDIDASVRKVLDGSCDSLLSVTENGSFLWSREGRSINYDFMKRPRSQDKKWEYTENGAIYVTRTEFLKKGKNRLGGRIGFHVMPRERSFEIDTQFDFFVAENAMKYAMGGGA